MQLAVKAEATVCGHQLSPGMPYTAEARRERAAGRIQHGIWAEAATRIALIGDSTLDNIIWVRTFVTIQSTVPPTNARCTGRQ